MQASPAPVYPLFPCNANVMPVANSQYNMDIPELTSAPSSPESITSPPTPDLTTLHLKKSPKKSKNPDHVPRHPNAFIIFRSDMNRFFKEHNINMHQKEFSQWAGSTWNHYLSEEKKRYGRNLAAKKSREHREFFPHRSQRKPSKKRGSASIKSARKQKPYDWPSNKTIETKSDDTMFINTLLSVPPPELQHQLINVVQLQSNTPNTSIWYDGTNQFNLTSTPMPPMPPAYQNQSFDLNASDGFNVIGRSPFNDDTVFINTLFSVLPPELQHQPINAVQLQSNTPNTSIWGDGTNQFNFTSTPMPPMPPAYQNQSFDLNASGGFNVIGRSPFNDDTVFINTLFSVLPPELQHQLINAVQLQSNTPNTSIWGDGTNQFNFTSTPMSPMPPAYQNQSFDLDTSGGFNVIGRLPFNDYATSNDLVNFNVDQSMFI